MLNKLDDKLKTNKKIRIEHNLLENIHIYAAILLKPEPVFENSDERMISVLKNNKAAWVEDDKKFFNENPKVRFRARKIYFGELEETYIDKPHLKVMLPVKGLVLPLYIILIMVKRLKHLLTILVCILLKMKTSLQLCLLY